MSKKKLMPLKNCKNCIFYCEGIENAVCTQTNYILDFGFDGEIPLNCPLEEFNCPLEGKIYQHLKNQYCDLLADFRELKKQYLALKSQEWSDDTKEWLKNADITVYDTMISLAGAGLALPIELKIFLKNEFGFNDVNFGDNVIYILKSDD